MKNKKNKRGFTLIELLVVVLIIGILAAVAVPQYNKAVVKSRVVELKSFITSAEKAIELYIINNGMPAIRTSLTEEDLDINPFAGLKKEGNTYWNPRKEWTANIFSSGPHIAGQNGVFKGIEIFSSYNQSDGSFSYDCSVSSTLESTSNAITICTMLAGDNPNWTISLPSV